MPLAGKEHDLDLSQHVGQPTYNELVDLLFV